MLKITRNLALLMVMAGFMASPVAADPEDCWDSGGDYFYGATLNGSELCGGDWVCIYFDSECTQWICDDITEGLGTQCPQ